MSSILKVNTIQDLDGNLIISKDSGGSGFLSPYASSSAPITYTVTVASKTSAHPYNGVGSSNGYFINGIESPIIEIKGNDTSKPYHYKFDQSDSSNSGHPLLFYNNVGKTTGFSTGVTTNGTPGQAGAYTMIAVDSQTPNILYYQCSSHANMGNHTFATSPVVNTGVFLTLPTADGSSGQFVTTNGSGVLSFAAGTTLSGSTNNTVATVTGANALAGEANLTFDGSTLGVNGAAIFNESGADKDFRVESDGNANMLFVDGGTNRVGIGKSNPAGVLDVTGSIIGTGLQIDGDAVIQKASGDVSLTIAANENSSAREPALKLKGANSSSNPIIEFGDSTSYTGSIQYENADKSMQFGTNSSERMRIHSNGVLSAANGVALGVGTANTNSNVLDDYEEGTWTPVMTTSGGSLSSVAYGAYNKGWYTKVGRNVTINFNVHLSSKGSGGSGAVRMSGYPFSGTTLLTASVYGSLYMYNGGVDQPCCTYGTWQNYVTIRYVNGTSGGEITWANISNNSSWSGMMTFITNQ